MPADFTDIFYDSPDGLRLYARDYGADKTKPVILCLHGLTRNSADFHNLALHLRGEYRVICPDQRGRGKSAYDSNPAQYRPDIYCADMFALLAHLGIENYILIGTSMGGIMAMLMNVLAPRQIQAAVLNDIGPDIDPAGLARIKNYVGGAPRFKTWAAAVSAIKAQGPEAFPKYTHADWQSFARRICQEQKDGAVEFAYDPAIALPFKSNESAAAPVDMWPLYHALANIPLLIVRGVLSDILNAETAEKMRAAHKRAIYAEIPNIGHAPMLDEPQSLRAIDDFLRRFKTEHP